MVWTDVLTMPAVERIIASWTPRSTVPVGLHAVHPESALRPTARATGFTSLDEM